MRTLAGPLLLLCLADQGTCVMGGSARVRCSRLTYELFPRRLNHVVPLPGPSPLQESDDSVASATPIVGARSGEEVADCAHSEGVVPSTSAMLAGVVTHVATLAERGEIARPVVAWIMVQVCACEDHARDTQMSGRGDANEPGLRA